MQTASHIPTAGIHHISCGYFCPPLARWTYGGGASPFSRARYVIHCLIIELPAGEDGQDGGLALLDTGLGRADMDHPLARLGWQMTWFGGATAGKSAAEAVTGIGAQMQPRRTAQDVRHILMTHLDKDHSGGLADFPDAHVHVQREAREIALPRRGYRAKKRVSPAHFAHVPKWQCFDVDPQSPSCEPLLASFPGTRTLPGLPDSILAVPLPGHAPGHCGYALRTERGWLLHCGDAVYHRAWLDGRRPPLAIQLVERLLEFDGAALRRTRHELRTLQAQGSLRLFCAHDPVAYEGLRRQSSAGGHQSSDSDRDTL